jgi:hypothetical protein
VRLKHDKPYVLEETMLDIILGLFFIALGIWGLFDDYYYVADFVKGGLPIALILSGLIATLAGFIPPKGKEESDG